MNETIASAGTGRTRRAAPGLSEVVCRLPMVLPRASPRPRRGAASDGAVHGHVFGGRPGWARCHLIAHAQRTRHLSYSAARQPVVHDAWPRRGHGRAHGAVDAPRARPAGGRDAVAPVRAAGGRAALCASSNASVLPACWQGCCDASAIRARPRRAQVLHIRLFRGSLRGDHQKDCARGSPASAVCSISAATNASPCRSAFATGGACRSPAESLGVASAVECRGSQG